MKIKKVIRILTVMAILALGAVGCTKNEKEIKLDPENPVSVEVWYYYGGNQKNAFDELIKDFNGTVGLDEGIVVEGVACGGVQELSERVLNAAGQKVGTNGMPQIFQGYPNDVYPIAKMDLLVNLEDYLSEEEENQYIQEYLEEGRMGEGNELKIFPVAKSTELLLLNQTDWDKFAAQSGCVLSELDTVEGLIRVSEKYYDWSGGKAFFGRDAMANYLLVGAKELGSEIIRVENGKVSFQLEPEVMKKLWDGYYVPYIHGYFAANGKFRSDDAKVGDILAFVGSTTSVTYFPKEVFQDENTSYPVEAAVRYAPVFEDGSNYAVQQGAGMAVAKSTREQEYASVEFLKWLTEEERNLEFSAQSGYLPVKKEAQSYKKLKLKLGEAVDSMDGIMQQTLEKAFDMQKSYQFYTPKVFDNSESARVILENSLSDKSKADKEKIDEMIQKGTDREKAIQKFDTQENFESWLQDLRRNLEDTQKG